MIKNMFFLVCLNLALGFGLSACTTNPNKAEPIKTELTNRDSVTGDTSLGLKEGEMVVQKKVLMSEELRRLQNDVYSLEDRVYGSRAYGSLGLYGVLRKCREETSDKKNGGDGKLTWTEPVDRITEKDDQFKMGLDEKKKLVGVSEEFLKDRIKKLRDARNILEKRQDEYEEKISICKVELKSRQSDSATH